MTITTTFHQCRRAGACLIPYEKMARELGGIRKYGLDTPTPVLKVLDTLGLSETLWVLDRATNNEGTLISIRLGADYLTHILHILEARIDTTPIPRRAIHIRRACARKPDLIDAWGKAWKELSINIDYEYSKDAFWGNRRIGNLANSCSWHYAAGGQWNAFDISPTRHSVVWNNDRKEEEDWQEARLRKYLTSPPPPLRLPPKPKG